MKERECVCACECEREKESLEGIFSQMLARRERGEKLRSSAFCSTLSQIWVCVGVCVRWRGSERVCACLCECEREKERERETDCVYVRER